MRLEGIIKTWNDERGFGFVEPAEGGQDVFVHVTAFRDRATRPHVGQKITFEIESNGAGKTRAKRAEPAGAIRPVHRPATAPSAPSPGIARYLPIPIFIALYVGVMLVWQAPLWVLGVYAVASVVTASAYASDKAAAVEGRWRVSEATLLALGLFGGWPGAIIAQEVLRHKSSKASFRDAFWGTVILNIIGVLLLVSPFARSLMGK